MKYLDYGYTFVNGKKILVFSKIPNNWYFREIGQELTDFQIDIASRDMMSQGFLLRGLNLPTKTMPKKRKCKCVHHADDFPEWPDAAKYLPNEAGCRND